MCDNILFSEKYNNRYIVERAIIEAKGMDKKRYLILEDGIPITAINHHLLIKQERQAHPSSTSSYNLCLFLNYINDVGITFLDVTMSDIYNFLFSAFVEDGKTYYTISSYIYDIATLYESLAVRNYSLDPSLYRPISEDSSPRIKRNKRDDSLTMISKLRNEFIPKKTDNVKSTYIKWYNAEQIELIAKELPLVYRCIFYDTIFTGHRIDSALSIMLDGVDLRNGLVRPTRTKTGKIHTSTIPPMLTNMIQSYLIEARRQIVASTGSADPYLFLGNNGLPIEYSAYYSALKRAGESASKKNPRINIKNLHTHAGRSTFAAVLRSYQLEQRRQGNETFTDADFCTLMDWKSLENLDNYDIATRAQEVSPLLNKFFSNYMNIADVNLSHPYL